MENIKNCIFSYKKYIASILAIMMTLTTFSQLTFAQMLSAETSNTYGIMESAMHQANEFEYLSEREANVIAEFFTDILLQDELNINVTHSYLNFDNISVKQNGEGYIQLFVPIEGYKFNIFSNVSVLLDRDLNILKSLELHVTESVNGLFEVTSFLNGEFLSVVETEYSFIDNEEFNEQLRELEEYLSNPRQRGLIRCLAIALGVSIAVAGLIAAACAVACAVTFGTGCVLCMGAFVAVSPVAAYAAISCFTNN